MIPDPITTFRRECAELLERYVDEVEEIVATFEASDVDNEPHDTERPPAFTGEEVNTFEPTTRTLADEDELQAAR